MDAPSLPVGILNETSFARRDDVLGDGDLIVLMSDGAVAAGDAVSYTHIYQKQRLAAQSVPQYCKQGKRLPAKTYPRKGYAAQAHA